MFGTLAGRYHGDYFGRLEIVFVAVAYGHAWLEYPHGSIIIAQPLAMLLVEAQAAEPQAIGIVEVVAPRGDIDIAHAFAIVDVEAEPYEEP